MHRDRAGLKALLVWLDRAGSRLPRLGVRFPLTAPTLVTRASVRAGPGRPSLAARPRGGFPSGERYSGG